MKHTIFRRLPIELFDLIMVLLPTKDRKTLHRTCQHLNSLCTPWAFREVHTFLSGVDNWKRGKGFTEIVKKYGRFVRTIFATGSDGNPRDHPTYTWVMFPADKLWKRQYLEFCQASLCKHPLFRTLENLSSLELSDISRMDRSATGFCFIIPSLRNITIRGIKHSPNFRDMEEYYGQTNLKSLTLDWSLINLESLKIMLSFPKALVHLDIGCALPLFRLTDPRYTAKALCDALSLQRESLESLVLRDLGIASDPPVARTDVIGCVESDYSIDLSAFPRLRKYKGVFLDSSGRFEQDAEDYAESSRLLAEL